MKDKLKQNRFFIFLYKYIYLFFELYISNYIISVIPSWSIRKIWYKLIGMRINNNSCIDMHTYIMSPKHINIGKHTHINQSCFLDGRGEIEIGNYVSISHYAKICTGGHDILSPFFVGQHGKVCIEDYCWVGIGAIILKNVRLKKGCVIAAGSVVTKDVEPYTIVAGIPAKEIGKRISNLNYTPIKNEIYFRYQ